MERKLVSIVLPMYNEELSFVSLRRMFDEDLRLPEGYDCGIVIVNDGSCDRTPALAREWSQADFRVEVVSHETNRGLGQAIMTGFRRAVAIGADVILTMDADVSHPVDTIGCLLKAIDDGADIAIASRFAPGGEQFGVSRLRRLYSLGARLVLGTVFPLRGVRDYTVNFRAYRASVVERALPPSGGFIVFNSFAAAAEILLKLAPLAGEIKEVPLILHYDYKESGSKLRAGATIKDYLRLCFMPGQRYELGRGLKITGIER